MKCKLHPGMLKWKDKFKNTANQIIIALNTYKLNNDSKCETHSKLAMNAKDWNNTLRENKS